METLGLAISVISNCINLVQQINNLIQISKDVPSEVHDGARTVATTSKLLIQFHYLFEISCLPQEILQGYLTSDIALLESELDAIKYFLSLYLPQFPRKRLAGLAWSRYKLGREIDRRQKNLAKLNDHLHEAIATLVALNLKVEKTHAKSPTKDEATTDSTTNHTSAINREYLEAAREIRRKESQIEPPIIQIQRTYSLAAMELRGNEWSRPRHSAAVREGRVF